MSNRDKCVALLNDFSEAQLVNDAAMLQSMKQAIADPQCNNDCCYAGVGERRRGAVDRQHKGPVRYAGC